VLFFAREVRQVLDLAFPETAEGYLPFEHFQAKMRFSVPSDCETYIAQTDSTSEELWKELTGREDHTPIELDELAINMAMFVKEKVAPGKENNCFDLDLSAAPEDATPQFSSCEAAKLSGACEESSPHFSSAFYACPLTCGFCHTENDIAPAQWTIEDFFEYSTSDKMMATFSFMDSDDRETFQVDEFTHETLPEWEEQCKSVRRRLYHPCLIAAAVGGVAGAAYGGYKQCRGGFYGVDDVTRCAVRGVLGGAVAGAAIGGIGCMSIGGLGFLFGRTAARFGSRWGLRMVNGRKHKEIYSTGLGMVFGEPVRQVATWPFQSVSRGSDWYSFGTGGGQSWLGRRN